MNSPKSRQVNGWSSLAGAFLVLAAVGCRHPARPSPEPAAGLGSDSASNVMIVPAAAGWARRPDATNRLPAGIVSPQPFPFPLYDQPLVRSIYDRWQKLLQFQPQPVAKTEVVFEFELHADGSISRVRLLPGEESPRLEKLCEQAIVESAPFPKWTPEMVREIGADVRSIRIGFDLGSGPKAP